MTKKSSIIISFALLLSLLTAGCSQDNPNATMGTVLGAVGGGLLGTQIGSGSGRTAAIIAGSAAGAMVGKSVGERMDKVDRLNLNNALQNQSDNKSSTWVNPSNNVRYTVTPTATSNQDGKYCRNYRVNKIINGQSKTVNEKACRVNGRWVSDV